MNTQLKALQCWLFSHPPSQLLSTQIVPTCTTSNSAEQQCQQENTTDWKVNHRMLSGIKLLYNTTDLEQNFGGVQVHQNCCKVKPARTKIATKLSPRVPNVDRSLTICGPSVPHSSTTAAPPLFIRFTQMVFRFIQVVCWHLKTSCSWFIQIKKQSDGWQAAVSNCSLKKWKKAKLYWYVH